MLRVCDFEFTTPHVWRMFCSFISVPCLHFLILPHFLILFLRISMWADVNENLIPFPVLSYTHSLQRLINRDPKFRRILTFLGKKLCSVDFFSLSSWFHSCRIQGSLFSVPESPVSVVWYFFCFFPISSLFVYTLSLQVCQKHAMAAASFVYV